MSKMEENVGEEILKDLKDIKMLLEPNPAPPLKKGLWNKSISKYKC